MSYISLTVAAEVDVVLLLLVRLLEHSYKCSACAEFNKAANIEDKRTTSYHAWDPACLERLPDRVSREYPFIPTRKSAMHVRLIDRLAHDLINGKGFAATANYIRQVWRSCGLG